MELLGVSFHDERHGWVGAGAGKGGSAAQLFSTNDGGATWTPLALPEGTGRVIDLSLIDPTHGYVLAHSLGRQLLLATDDGGRTWRTTDVEQRGLARVVASGPNRAIAVGGTMSGTASRAEVMVTQDGGVTWNAVDTPGLPRLSDVAFNGSRGWADADHAGPCLFVTDDEGRTWTPRPLVAGAACSGP